MKNRKSKIDTTETIATKLRTAIREAVKELTSDKLFLLSLIVFDREHFGNKFVYLVSKTRLNIRFVKDRGDLEFWCELKWAEPPFKLFPLENHEEYYSETSLLGVKEESNLSNQEFDFIFFPHPEGWFNLDPLLSMIGVEPIHGASNFIEFISATTKLIKSNLPLIVNSFDDNNRATTIRKVNEWRLKV